MISSIGALYRLFFVVSSSFHQQSYPQAADGLKLLNGFSQQQQITRA